MEKWKRSNTWKIRKDYTKNLSELLEEFKLKCGQYKIEFTEADVNDDFQKVLIPFLVKRKVMV